MSDLLMYYTLTRFEVFQVSLQYYKCDLNSTKKQTKNQHKKFEVDEKFNEMQLRVSCGQDLDWLCN